MATFGKSEDLTCITHITLKGQNDEALCIAYKTSTYHVFAPIYMSDDGYVLKSRDANFFYPIPQGAELKAFVASGDMPATMPPYQLSLADYAIGFLLWWILLALGVYAGLKTLWQKARAPAAVTSPVGDGFVPPSE